MAMVAQKRTQCKDCEKRTVGCHSTCEEYQEYNKKNEARRKKQRSDNDIAGVLIRAVEKSKALGRNRRYG